MFDRSGYRPVLTDAGKFYYHGCVEIRNQYDNLEKNLKNAFDQTLSGFTGSYENKDIITLIQQFKKSHPLVQVSFVEGNFENCINNLINDKVDVSFGLESDFRGRSGIDYRILHSYDLCVICSFDHPFASMEEIDVQLLRNQDFIVLSKAFGKGFFKDFMNAFKLDKIQPKIKKKVDSFDELVFNVSIGEGISIVSNDVVRESDVKTIPLVHSHHQSQYVIGYKQDVHKKLIKDFIEESSRYFQTL